MRLEYAAISDVGRVRKDNQDSGYVGPHVIAVCDGVGGAARGDIASSTAISQLRRLDDGPADDEQVGDLLGQVSGALHRAHDRIGELVDENPALSGTSTTATVALFDGTTLGDGPRRRQPRLPAARRRRCSQLTKDHTFVQTLIDDGQITEEESRHHPHRNLILKAIDGIHDLEPDLFQVDLEAGDRLLFCSDGACGVLDAERLGDILRRGQRRLRRGRAGAREPRGRQHRQRDLPGRRHRRGRPRPHGRADAGRRRRRAAPPRPRASAACSAATASGDTGELEPVQAEIPDDVAVRDPLRPDRPRGGALRPAAAAPLHLDPPRSSCCWSSSACSGSPAPAAWSWTQSQYYVGEYDGMVTIYRGVNADLPGVDLSSPYEVTDLAMDRPQRVRPGPGRGGPRRRRPRPRARRTVDNLVAEPATDERRSDGGT